MARQKCPYLKVFKGDYQKYGYYSNQLYQLLLTYTDKIERFSIDECFMDITHYLMGRTVMDIAEEIRARVKEELRFYCKYWNFIQ